MSRAWRIEYDGALYHLMSRGNARGLIFIDDRDRSVFIDAVEQMSERFEMDIIAYVLMPNHYHLLARTRQANLKKAMHWLGTAYTQRFNWRHHRFGHLFQGRYKSIIVENDAYLLQLSYYIHRNPLRAGIVKRLADYRWSSYKVYAYGRKSPEWLYSNLILSQFEGVKDRYKSYREKAQKYAKEEKQFLENIRHGLIIGTEQFAEQISKTHVPSRLDAALPQQKQLASTVDIDSFLINAENILGCDIKDFVQAGRLSGADKDNRDVLLYAIWRIGRMKNEQIGKLFGISYSAVSHAVCSIRKKLKKEKKLREKMDLVNSLFKL